MTSVKAGAVAVCLCILVLGSACGSGSSSHKSAQNSQGITVSGGPDNNYANGVFTTVTICVAGSSNCQTIANVLVDTGSFGLRVLSSALGNLSSSLKQQNDPNGMPVYECAQFVSSVVWGPVKTADVTMAGEKAASVPIQVIDASTIPVPAGCKAIGPAEEDLAALGANGILGIGFFISDCGGACTLVGSSNPGFYYGCSGSSCSVIAQNTGDQVQNPVAFFAGDNNGIIIQLPSASSTATILNGSMIFGVGTQTNNAAGKVQVYAPDKFGNLVTTFKGQQYSGFLDTGSNAYFFLDSSLTGLANCSSPEKGFYCPSSPVTLTAANASALGGSSQTVQFTIGNASQLFSKANGFVFPSLGGPNPGSFDWGLPFFFGRKVFVAIEGRTTSLGAGPFWAY